jgi:hypothetical protein
MHYTDRVAGREGFVLIVRHQYGGCTAALEDLAHLTREPLAQF